jgi:translation initiation factor 2 beta subunit (eIF-2beta)/eIF-5
MLEKTLTKFLTFFFSKIMMCPAHNSTMYNKSVCLKFNEEKKEYYKWHLECWCVAHKEQWKRFHFCRFLTRTWMSFCSLGDETHRDGPIQKSLPTLAELHQHQHLYKICHICSFQNQKFLSSDDLYKLTCKFLFANVSP